MAVACRPAMRWTHPPVDRPPQQFFGPGWAKEVAHRGGGPSGPGVLGAFPPQEVATLALAFATAVVPGRASGSPDTLRHTRRPPLHNFWGTWS